MEEENNPCKWLYICMFWVFLGYGVFLIVSLDLILILIGCVLIYLSFAWLGFQHLERTGQCPTGGDADVGVCCLGVCQSHTITQTTKHISPTSDCLLGICGPQEDRRHSTIHRPRRHTNPNIRTRI